MLFRSVNAVLAHLLNLGRDVLDDRRIDAEALVACERLTTELQDDAFIFRCFQNKNLHPVQATTETYLVFPFDGKRETPAASVNFSAPRCRRMRPSVRHSPKRGCRTSCSRRERRLLCNSLSFHHVPDHSRQGDSSEEELLHLRLDLCREVLLLLLDALTELEARELHDLLAAEDIRDRLVRILDEDLLIEADFLVVLLDAALDDAVDDLGRLAFFLGLLASDFLDREERRVGKECRSRWSPYH